MHSRKIFPDVLHRARHSSLDSVKTRRFSGQGRVLAFGLSSLAAAVQQQQRGCATKHCQRS